MRRKVLLLLAGLTSCVMATLGLGFATSAPAHHLQVSYPNFACAAIGSIGLCIGAPTSD